MAINYKNIGMRLNARASSPALKALSTNAITIPTNLSQELKELESFRIQ